MYQPIADSARPSGYRFSNDGTRLWIARTPAPDVRNIYTVLPGGGIRAFTSGIAAELEPYLATPDAAGLIEYVRSLPIGAVIGSTPAFEDPPSLDPPPDEEYAAFKTANQRRRSLVFVGANDGMLHALDGRTGVEVWAFIPFNLLPKLRALREGQPVDRFLYYVDGSPRVADVKVDGAWRTYVIFGEGLGGTFYQGLDVTFPDMAGALVPESDDIAQLLAYFSDAGRILFKWSFPNYGSFDCTASFPDAPYGDLKASAPAIEKTVGTTCSVPAAGQVGDADGPFVILTGSGFLATAVERQANRGGKSAGTTFYMLAAADGRILDIRDVGNDGKAENVDDCGAAGSCANLKNALQADPVAAGPSGSRFINKAYAGDADGRLWRFDIALEEGRAPRFRASPIIALSGSGRPADSVFPRHCRRRRKPAVSVLWDRQRPLAVRVGGSAKSAGRCARLRAGKSRGVRDSPPRLSGRRRRREGQWFTRGRRRCRLLHDDQLRSGGGLRRVRFHPVCADVHWWAGLRQHR